MNKSIVMDGDEVKKHLVNISVMHVKNGNTHEYIDINGNDNDTNKSNDINVTNGNNNIINNDNHDINGHTTNVNNNIINNNNGHIIRNGNHLTQDTQKKINIVITTPKSNDKITTPPSNDNEDSFGDDFDINNNDDDDDDNNGYSSNNSPYTNDENNSTPLSLHKKQQNTMQLHNNYTASGNHEPTGTTVINRLSAVFANSPKNNNEPRSTLVVHDPGNSMIFDEKSDNEDETYNESPFLPTERLPKHLISDSVESLDPDFVLEPAYFEDEMDIYPNDKIPLLNTNAVSNDKTNDNNEIKQQHYILKSVDITQSIKWDKPGVSIDHVMLYNNILNNNII